LAILKTLAQISERRELRMWILGLVGASIVAVPLFIWIYQRRLDVLTGPWITRDEVGDGH